MNRFSRLTATSSIVSAGALQVAQMPTVPTAKTMGRARVRSALGLSRQRARPLARELGRNDG
jgi:hypothetical protein